MKNILEQLFPDRKEKIKNFICIMCNCSATKFRNKKALEEFYRSGVCQNCQDGIANVGGMIF